MRAWPPALLALCLIFAAPSTRSQDLDAYIQEGDRHFHVGDYKAAVRAFDAAAARFPGEPIPRLARGHAFFALGRFAEASRSLQEGIDLLPAWSESGIDLRGFFRDPTEFDGNLDRLARAVEASPEDADLMFLLAYCLHFSGAPERARTVFDYVLELAPGHAAALTFVERAL